MIDPFTIKPLDAATILASARATGGQIITVEDHYKEGRPMCFTVSVKIFKRGKLITLAQKCKNLFFLLPFYCVYNL